MGKITNKLQLTSKYNRRQVYSSKGSEDVMVSKPNNSPVDWDYIHCECDKPLRSRWAVKATKVAKANNYDIEVESQRLYKLQEKYNTCDWYWIQQQENIKRNRILQLKEERSKDTVEKRNRIARMKASQAISVDTAKKKTFTECFAFQNKASIIRMACG